MDCGLQKTEQDGTRWAKKSVRFWQLRKEEGGSAWPWSSGYGWHLINALHTLWANNPFVSQPFAPNRPSASPYGHPIAAALSPRTDTFPHALAHTLSLTCPCSPHNQLSSCWPCTTPRCKARIPPSCPNQKAGGSGARLNTTTTNFPTRPRKGDGSYTRQTDR